MNRADGLATLFFRNRHLLVLAIVAILAAGASAFLHLPRLEDPRIVNRNPLVITRVPGASAERVEALVTEKLEEAFQEVPEIKTLESISRAGVSIVAIELDDRVGAETNQEIFSKIRDRLADARAELPPEAQEPDFDDQRDPVAFTLIVAVLADEDAETGLGLLDRLAEDLADRLRNVSGTELVRLYGVPEEEITVTIDADALLGLGLDAGDVARRLRDADVKVPAGAVRGRRADFLLEVTGELDSARRVATVPLAQGPAGELVRLGDVAEVRRDERRPAREIAMVDGRRGILVAARMGTGQKVGDWTAEARGIVDTFAKNLGDGIEIDIVFEQALYTQGRLAELGGNLLAGALVVLAVVLLMMGWRSALIVGVALPLVVSLVLFGLQASGNALHQMSIFGMIIALGLLIDNAIVVTDEVGKRRLEGATRQQAVAETVRHLFLPLLASTVTTVLAFAPILLLPGGAGDFVGSIGESVILALTFSFLVSMTIIVTLAGLLLPAKQPASRRSFWRDGIGGERLTRTARHVWSTGLQMPVAAIAFAVFLPFAGFVVGRSLGNEFFPPVDRDMLELEIHLPTETSIDHTRRAAAAIEAAIREEDDVERVHWLLGGSFPTVWYNLVMNRDGSPHYGQAIIETASSEATKRLIPRLQARLDEEFPEAQVIVRQLAQGPPIEADVELRLTGPGLSTLQDLGEDVRRTLQSHPDVLHARVSLPRGEPKLWLDADEDEARLAGLTLGDLAGQLQANLEGVVGGSVVEDLEELPVRIRHAEMRRDDLSAIARTSFLAKGGAAGSWVPLEAIGKLELRPEIGGISRYDTVRANRVEGFTRSGALPIDVSRQVMASLEAEGFHLPAGYSLTVGGALEQDAEARGNLMTYAPLLGILMVSTLILTFRSVRLAAVLGLVAFLSIGLGLLATWTIGFPVSFNTILGTLGLVGVALNDSIVVLAAIRGDAAARRGEVEAVAAATLGTARHVISTTLTTIGGFLPLLLFVGGDFWPSLAIVLAGGIGGATILALVFVPATYVLFHRSVQPSDQPATVPDLAFEGGVA